MIDLKQIYTGMEGIPSRKLYRTILDAPTHDAAMRISLEHERRTVALQVRYTHYLKRQIRRQK